MVKLKSGDENRSAGVRASRFVVFTKIFGDRHVEEVASHVSELGFDGADLLIRTNGTINPERVEEQLPKAVEVMHAHGLSVPLVTTDVFSPEDPLFEKVLALCKDLGIGRVRLGWWRYDAKRDHAEQWDAGRRQLAALGELAFKYDVLALLQVHGGALHLSPTRTAMFMDGIPDDHVAIYFDPGNMMHEGFEQWPLAVNMVKDRLGMVGVKNCGWTKTEGERVVWKRRWIGVDQGVVDWERVFRLLGGAGYKGAYSLHPFYHDVSFEKALEQTKKDLIYVRSVVGE